jgi:catechol 2,3-dioxygenase-like lactoylglutathione lyase family enzyme
MAKPNITGVGRVTVPSADQDRSLAFYTETLGFELRVDETFAGGQMRWIEVAPTGGSTAIALTPPMGDFQPGRQTGNHRLDRRHRSRPRGAERRGRRHRPGDPAHGRSRTADVHDPRPGRERVDDRRAPGGLVQLRDPGEEKLTPRA